MSVNNLQKVEEINISPAAKIDQAAASHGIALDESRLEKLTSAAEKLERRRRDGHEAAYHDDELGIFAGAPGAEIWRSDASYFVEEGTAAVDFMPMGYISAAREHMTQIMHYGIQGIQNYMLLVEAGYIPRPAELYGETNHEMVKIAERFGYEPTGTIANIHDGGTLKVIIRAPFETVKERIFSQDILRFDKIATKRLAAARIGNAAISDRINK